MAEFHPIRFLAEAIRTAYDNRSVAFRLSWPWFMFFVLPVSLVSSFVIAPVSNQTTYAPSDWWRSAVVFVLFVAEVVALSSIAVNWHRYLLLGEVAEGRLRVRLDAVVWRYFRNVFAVGIATILLAIVILTVVGLFAFPIFGLGNPEAVQDHIVSWSAAMFLSMLLPFAVAFRMSIKLPCIALGEKGYGFGDAWQDSRAVFLPILLFVAIYGLIDFGPMTLLNYWDPHLHSTTAGVLFSALVYFAWRWIMTILHITTLTLAYQVFHQGRRLA
jgi:hypothetical protein